MRFALILVFFFSAAFPAYANLVPITGEWSINQVSGQGYSFSGANVSGFLGDGSLFQFSPQSGLAGATLGFAASLTSGGDFGSITMDGVTFGLSRGCAIHLLPGPCASGMLSIGGILVLPTVTPPTNDLGIFTLTFPMTLTGQFSGCSNGICHAVTFNQDAIGTIGFRVNAIAPLRYDSLGFMSATYSASAVPEPTSLVLAGSGMALLAGARGWSMRHRRINRLRNERVPGLRKVNPVGTVRPWTAA